MEAQERFRELYLTQKAPSVKQVRQQLKREGFPVKIIAQVTGRSAFAIPSRIKIIVPAEHAGK